MKRVTLATCSVWMFSTAITIPSAFAAGSVYVVDQARSEVSFLATGKPGFLKIRGEGATLAGSIKVADDQVAGDLTAKLTPLKTGIGLRDEHMHEKYLETGKFPTAVLKLKDVKVSGNDCSFEGLLTIKNTEKPVSGKCEAEGLGSDTLKVTATTEIKMDDYPIGVPSHLGITVAEKVAVTANVVASRSATATN